MSISKDKQFYKFSLYGFFKNLKFFDPVLLLFFIDKGISYSEIGILYAFRELVINIFEIISGVIADVFGRKRAMIGAFVSYLISFVLFYSFANFWGFMLAFLFYGVGDSFRTGTHKAMIHAYLVRNQWLDIKTRYYGMTRSWSQKGAAISSLLSAAFIFYTGDYSLMFLFTLVPYFFDLVLISSYPSYLNGNKSEGWSTILLDFKKHLVALYQSVKELSALKALVLTSSFTGYYKAMRDYVQLIVTSLSASLLLSKSFSEEQNIAIYIGVTYFLIYWLTSFASKKAFLFEKYLKGVKNSLSQLQIIGYVLGFIAGMLFLFDYYLFALLFFSCIFIIQNLRKPLAMNYITLRFDDDLMASVMSVESQSETVFTAIFALILGILVEVFGLGWGITSLSVVLIVLSLLIRRLKI
ncbi:MFS transporter [Carboxylicivirga marina]|uniref:MFS transporter n=1 Tax=Carboxylicivirga marina TaxID=2800988 RepID=UPI0025939666|nr:MFS transporter [uncultured Carboxylicivirga sp.]